MKIDVAGITPDPGTGHARATTAYAQQWRKALEDATRQARQRIAPGEPGGGNPDGTAAGTAAAPAMSAAGAAELAAVAPAPAIAAAPTAAAARTDALACAVADAAVRIASVRYPVFAAPVAALPAGEQVLAATGASEAASAAPVAATGWQALPEWPAVMVNASIQGNRVSVAMRDGTVQEQDKLSLFYRLRAQLRAAGFALTSLTVNGHNVAPADDAARRSA